MLRVTEEGQLLSQEYTLRQVDLQQPEGEEKEKKIRHTAGVNFNCQCKKWQGRAGHPSEVRKAWSKHGELAR